ncbi:hypothetical protein [Muribaculum sp.]|jgi:hypothetical protein|uniref:hypothetical protein n=1 Tax=Muribaculum sp. TaxID=1918611 RepID=UPI00257953AB|nr:hypothetical protein [Muribaculum sp.]
MSLNIIFMPSCWIAIGTVEICVLLLIVAAAILAAAMNHTQINSIETVLVAGTIDNDTSAADNSEIAFGITDSFDLVIKRRHLSPQTTHAALALTIKNRDINIEEHLQTDRHTETGTPVEATFLISCLKPRTRYHIHYNSPAQSIHCSFGIITDAGYSGTCILKL